ncbi:MAG TPA: hypothetical protein VKR30_12290 [Candidatus Limnocylindrales bacterium]|nr:hypothetical protein [Candidatus Limnocylindrales bacterium]
MDLVAGERRAILAAIKAEDWAAFDDRNRFAAHLTLGGELDPTWLDLFSAAVRSVTDRSEPQDFLDARTEIDDPDLSTDRTVERVDAGWITAIARILDGDVGPVAARWIDLVEEETGQLPREEKPQMRRLAGDVVEFARRADRAPVVISAWTLG